MISTIHFPETAVEICFLTSDRIGCNMAVEIIAMETLYLVVR